MPGQRQIFFIIYITNYLDKSDTLLLFYLFNYNQAVNKNMLLLFF